jgi:hypothetical protein
MTRKSKVTTSLTNKYPEWTKVRSDEQSTGHSLINAVALQLEPLFTELYRNQKNFYLTTANVGEIDRTYIVDLPNYFEFQVDNTNNLSPQRISPTMSGYVNGTWYPVEEVISGSIEDFWYKAIPNRLTREATYLIDDYLVASGLSSDISLTLVNSGLLLENKLTVVVSGERLVEVDSDNNLIRSKVRIDGETWKETRETEDVVFLFQESKPSFKVWKNIDRICGVDFVTESTIDVYSHRFNQEYYLDSFDTMMNYQDTREQLPSFWKLDTSIAGNKVLTLQRYSTGKAIELLRGVPQIVDHRSWELLDSGNNNIPALDIAPVPYESRAWVVTSGMLYLYDTDLELPDLKALTLKTPGALVDLEMSSDYIVSSEEVEITCLFQRPIKTIVKHRLKIQYPDGAEFGILLDGTLVSTSSNYWVENETHNRIIRPSFVIELNDLGQHNITLEAVYFDGTTEFAQRAIVVASKTPLVEIDISEYTTTAIGVDVDYHNRLLVLDSSNAVHHFIPRYDLALIDYSGKQIVFREKYDEVKVIS